MASVALEDLSDRSSESQRPLPDALGAVLLPRHRAMLVSASFERKTPRGDEPSSIRAQTSAADLDATCGVPDRRAKAVGLRAIRATDASTSPRPFDCRPWGPRLPACFTCPQGRRTNRDLVGTHRIATYARR
jgi:hypothetical protein